jgi:hypothetical protein
MSLKDSKPERADTQPITGHREPTNGTVDVEYSSEDSCH